MPFHIVLFFHTHIHLLWEFNMFGQVWKLLLNPSVVQNNNHCSTWKILSWLHLWHDVWKQSMAWAKSQIMWLVQLVTLLSYYLRCLDGRKRHAVGWDRMPSRYIYWAKKTLNLNSYNSINIALFFIYMPRQKMGQSQCFSNGVWPILLPRSVECSTFERLHLNSHPSQRNRKYMNNLNEWIIKDY